MSTVYQITFTAEERDELLAILEQSLSDLRVECRRTEAPQYHEQVRHEKCVVQALADKLRGAGAQQARSCGQCG